MNKFIVSWSAPAVLLGLGLVCGAVANYEQTIERLLQEISSLLIPAGLWFIVAGLILRHTKGDLRHWDITGPWFSGEKWPVRLLVRVGKFLSAVLFLSANSVFFYAVGFAVDEAFITNLIAYVVFLVPYFMVFGITYGLRRWLLPATVGDTPPPPGVQETSSLALVLGKITTGFLTVLHFLVRPIQLWFYSVRFNRRVRQVHLGVLAVFFVSVLVYAGWMVTRPVVLTQSDLNDEYTLVRDTVPLDGPIIMRLPEGEGTFLSRYNVDFVPGVSTWWARTNYPDYIAFTLARPLEENNFYTISYEREDGTVETKTFRAVQRPRIDIFQPGDGATVNEDTILTFTFNRPMIPLQSLDRTYADDIPVTITPETEGEFVWVSQRQLEFVPANRLTRASEYTVSVSEGWLSNDGLEVPPATYEFSVKPFQMVSGQSGRLRAQDPAQFTFNQPVALEELDLRLVDGEGNQIATELTYASSLTYNPELEQKEQLIDRSTVQAQPVTNNGRWPFGETYSYALTGIAPLEGSTDVSEIEGTFNVATLLMHVTPVSPRFQSVREDYFDPAGVLALHFSQPVAVEQLEVAGKGVSALQYQSDCPSYDPDCGEVKTDVIEVVFDQSQFEFAETFSVSIGDVYAEDGVLIGRVGRTIELITVPKLEVYEVGPASDEEVHTLLVCSNNPLIQYDEDTFGELMQPVGVVDKFYQSYRSVFVPERKGFNLTSLPCEGAYRTEVRYELPYDAEVSLTLTPTDVFGDQVSELVQFKTPQKPDSADTVVRDPWLKNLHPQYTVTVPGRTAYTYISGNIDSLDVSICKVTPLEMLRIGGLVPDVIDGPLAAECVEERTDTISVPNTPGPNYTHIDVQTYFTDPRGHYIVTVTNPGVTVWRDDVKKQYFDHLYTSVTNLSLVEKRTQLGTHNNNPFPNTEVAELEQPTNLYWVTNHQTLEPVSDAVVTVYRDSNSGPDRNMQFGASAITGTDGIARTPVVADVGGAYVVSGEDSALVAEWSDRLNYASRASEIERVYTYTDRPIYRPGDEVFVKGIHRIGYDGAYEIYNANDLSVTLYNARGEVVGTEKVSLNQYGTFDRAFTLPEDAPLGTYRIHVSSGSNRYVGSVYFSVEEYTPSPFEVTAEANQDEFIAGDSAEFTIDAQYFFGAPVASGKVTYTIATQDYYFDRASDSRYRFGSYGCYYCRYNDALVTRGELELEGGSATIQQLLQDEELFLTNERYDDDQVRRSKILVLNATVVDGNGRSVSTQESFIVHSADRYAAVRTDNYFSEVNKETNFGVKTVDVSGAGVSQTVSVRIERLEWEEFKRREVDGSFYTKSDPVWRSVFATDVVTDSQGNYSFPYTFQQSGEYRVLVSGVDTRGNAFEGRARQYVYGPDSAPVRRNNDRTLDIVVEETDFLVGESTKLIVKSPYERAKALVTIERGKVIEYEVIDVDTNFFAYDFTAKEEYIPNVVTSIVLLSPDPAIKYGEVRFGIDTKTHEIDITVQSNKEAYLPGEEVTLFVQTKDHLGLPTPAEVSIAAVDLSVLALKGNPERDPLAYFYNGFPHTVITSSNLKHVHEEIEIPTGTKGGGGAGEDLAKRERGVFKDTAFWVGAVETDTSGTAVVKFTLPDNLTRWRVETIGVTKDTKLGINYMEFEEKKDLITNPLLPRFVVPGDTMALGAEILNRTKVSQPVTFTIESDTLEMIGEPQTVVIPSEESVRLFVPVNVPLSVTGGEHEVRFVAGNAFFEDAVRKHIPIVENTLSETVFLSGFTNGELAEETFLTPDGIHIDAGGVTVEAYSTLAAYLDDSINYMAAYPYGCSEQLASRVATLATLKYLTNLDNIGEEYDVDTIQFRGLEYSVNEAITSGLARMYEAQNADGGFGYYQNLQSDIALSFHILSVLKRLSDVGFPVDQKVLERGVGYIVTIADERDSRNDIVSESYSFEQLVSRVNTLLYLGEQPRSLDAAVQEVRRYITRDSLEAMSTYALVNAARMSDELWWWDRRNVWKEVEDRLRDTPDGTYISRHPTVLAKSYYETDVKNAAILLRAIIETERHADEATKLVNWLLAQRVHAGVWDTTNTTHEVVQTFTDYVVWKDEHHANAVITALVDDEVVASHDPAVEPRLEGLEAQLDYTSLGTNTEHTLTFTQASDGARDDTMYYDVAMQYYLDREVTPARDEGVQLRREFFALEDTDKESPLQTATVGEVVIGRLTFTVGSPMRLMAIEDKIPAGFELINFEYATENKDVIDAAIAAVAQAKKDSAFDVEGFMETTAFAEMEAVPVLLDERQSLKPNRQSYVRNFYGGVSELHDDRVFLFREYLEPGTYQYEYYLRALVPGTYQHLPAWVGEMYNPSFFGRTESTNFTIEVNEN